MNDVIGFIDQPDFAGAFGFGTGEEGDGLINTLLLATEVEDMAIGLGGVEDAVGTTKSLNQGVVAQVFIDIQSVEVFGVEAGEEHINDNGDIDLFGK